MLSIFEKKSKCEGRDPFPNNIILTIVGTARQTSNIDFRFFEINTSSFSFLFQLHSCLFLYTL